MINSVVSVLRETYYQCDVCNKTDKWTDTHQHIERTVGFGPAGWEVQFITCSDECRNSEIFESSFVNWLSKFPRWGNKSAQANFNKVFRSIY